MRPVNLMPAGERRGEGAPTRTGPLAYIIVGVLAVALAAVCGIVVFNKKVSDREAEATRIEAHATELEARADGLSSFVTFKQIHDSRVQTVEQLAQSRFDWERVLRELSKVIPEPHLAGQPDRDGDSGRRRRRRGRRRRWAAGSRSRARRSC